MAPRPGGTRSTGSAIATRPRIGCPGGGEGGAALAPFIGGTSGFPLPFAVPPRRPRGGIAALRAIVGRAVCLACGGPVKPRLCEHPPGHEIGVADAGRNQADEGEQPQDNGNHDNDADNLLNGRIDR